MKNVILSADGDGIVYLVPDIVAENLRQYCIEFCDKWMRTSVHARKYKIKGVYYYDESDFIDYLNEYVFPEEKSVFVKNLGWIGYGEDIPEEYKDCPYFNF